MRVSILGSAQPAQNSAPCIGPPIATGGDTGCGGSNGFPPNRHANPEMRTACRASAVRSSGSLAAMCSARRARVRPV